MRTRSAFAAIRRFAPAIAAVLTVGRVDSAMAQEGIASPWELWHQPAETPVAQHIFTLHFVMLMAMLAVCFTVIGLLIFIIIRFRESRNPTPSRITHNPVLETTWTVVPVLILVTLAVPSFRDLYYMADIPKTAFTVKAIGHQWYWQYQYPDQGNLTFTSLPIPDSDLKPGQPRLLTVDNPLVIPVGTNIRVITTGADVIHSWSVPSFGIKIDSVPGRTNEAWLRALHEGIFYGQCSELCGQNHDFMPIVVRVVSKSEFQSWLRKAKAQFAAADPGIQKVALAHTERSGHQP